jgi:hypothetical protein
LEIVTKIIMHHVDTFFPPDKLGLSYPEYLHTYNFDGFIDAFHEKLQTCSPQNSLVDLGINGWLRHADALKLYEMAYFAEGDILELGTYHGLSTYILANATKKHKIVSIDISPEAQAIAKENLSMFDKIEYILSDAVTGIQQLTGRKFAFIFVDHSHMYQPVFDVCQMLDSIAMHNAHVLFHDWNDARNGIDPNYGVYQAVEDGLSPAWGFCGCYGCTALYEFQTPSCGTCTI